MGTALMIDLRGSIEGAGRANGPRCPGDFAERSLDLHASALRVESKEKEKLQRVYIPALAYAMRGGSIPIVFNGVGVGVGVGVGFGGRIEVENFPVLPWRPGERWPLRVVRICFFCFVFFAGGGGRGGGRGKIL